MVQSVVATTPKPCTYYRQGHCVRGVHCKFSHVAASPTTPQLSAQAARHDEKPSTATVCEFYKQGSCRFGENCLYFHPHSPSGTPASRTGARLDFDPRSVHDNPPSSPPPSSVSFGLCKFYARGMCNKGEACPFPHPGAVVSKTTPLPPPPSVLSNRLDPSGHSTSAFSTHVSVLRHAYTHRHRKG